jgi:hypothetical protein
VTPRAERVVEGLQGFLFQVEVSKITMHEAAVVLMWAAEGEELSDDESLLLFRGLHILGGA